MTVTINRSAIIAMCATSAVIGGVLTMSALASATTPHQSSPSLAGRHYLRGAYVLTDGKCPKGTVAANATVRGNTNSPSGHSTFPLCYVK